MPLIIIVIIAFQLVLLYRAGRSDRLLRANTYIMDHAILGTHKPTNRRKRLIGPIDTLFNLLWQDENDMSILAMYLTVPGPANLHCSMARLPDDSSPDGFREVPLVWLEYRYHGHHYVSYYHHNDQPVTVSYFDFMATTYSDAKVKPVAPPSEPARMLTL